MNSVRELILEGLDGFVLTDVAKRDIAERLTIAIVAGYAGVPECHSLDHITVVARNALSVAGQITPREKLIMILSALAHDVSDDKFANNVERWYDFVGAMERILDDAFGAEKGRDCTAWIVFIVKHVGVSKEAGRDYMKVRSHEEWRELAKEVSPDDFETLLRIRHTVAGADIIEALGAHGHVRAVVHNGRLCENKFPPYSAELRAAMFEGVTWVHKNKHAKLCQWIHIPALREIAISRWDSMVEAYRTWAVSLGFVPEELVLVL